MSADVFREHVWIVTGASSGMGREVAYLLANQGAWLALASHDPERLETVAEACRQRGGRAVAIPTDVSEQAQCERLVARTVEEYGRLNVLFNNAGITMWARFEDLEDLSPLERIMRVNYLGSAYCTYYAIPHLKRTAGQIVVTSSVSGKTGVPYRSGYSASKHAVTGFFDALRIELAEYGISVTLVYPDFVSTETHQHAFGADGKPIGKSPVQKGKVMTPETAAQMIVDAAAKRQRDRALTMRGKLGPWMKLIAPQVVDRIALKAIESGT
jgi:NAD(P)-dependent dehydrogenase (short-subunit alcohol dehydrogenase family)